VVDDIVMSPTYAADAALLLRHLIASGHTGIVHATNAGACSWFEFARGIFTLLGWEADLRPYRSADLRGAARRPRNSALVSPRVHALGFDQPAWQDALHRYLIARGYLTEEGRGGAPAH